MWNSKFKLCLAALLFLSMSNIICSSLIPAIHWFIYRNCINCLLLNKCTTFKLFLSTVDLSTVQRPNNPHYHPFTVSASKFKDMYCADQHAEMQKAASMASVLVLIFPPDVLIFGLPTRKICLD